MVTAALTQALGTAVSLIVAIVIVFIVASLVNYMAIPAINLLAEISLTPLSVPVVNQVVLWGQVVALFIVLAIRIGYGLYAIVLNPGDDSPSFGEWVLKTILSIAGVMFMPTFCTLIITLGSDMFLDVQGATSSSIATLPNNTLSEDYLVSLTNGSLTDIMGSLANAVLVSITVFGAFAVVVQLFKRQVIMLIVSVVAVFVSIKAAMNSFNDYVDLLTNLFGLTCIQWLQYLFFAIAVTMVNSFVGDVSWIELDITQNGAIQSYMLVLGFLLAAFAVPQVVERYAFAAGRSGMGNMVVGMAVRGGIGSMGNAAKNAGRIAAGKGI